MKTGRERVWRVAPWVGMLVLIGASGGASAFPCNQGYVRGDQSGLNYACQDGLAGDNNDEASDLAGYFGLTGWTFLSKQNGVLTEPVDIDLVTTGVPDGTEGTWSFNSAVWDAYEFISIVIKDGRITPPDDGIYWSAYLVETDDFSGTWSMPTRQISHLSVYGIESTSNGGGGQAPEPGSLALLGVGALGAALSLRRRRIRV